MKSTEVSRIEDSNVWENSRTRLRFRQFPWMHWILGSLWFGGLIWVVISHGNQLFNLEHSHFTVYSFLVLASIIGFLFLYTGKVRTVVFDRNEFTVTLKKRNTCCDRRSIVTYNLMTLSDVRAINRSKKIGG